MMLPSLPGDFLCSQVKENSSFSSIVGRRNNRNSHRSHRISLVHRGRPILGRLRGLDGRHDDRLPRLNGGVVISILVLLSGAIMIVGAVMLRVHPQDHITCGALILVFA